MSASHAASDAGTRARILAAASVEFAARGFAGAGVDRIARRALVNKAMIYYHFRSKADLYQQILRGIFGRAAERMRAIAASERSPEQKVASFIETLVHETLLQPHFAPIMLRELAERGRHFDARTLRDISVMPRTFGAILQDGRARGVFREVDSLLAYCSVVGPLMFYVSSAPVRSHMTKLGLVEFEEADTRPLLKHVQESTLSFLRQTRPESARRDAGVTHEVSRRS